MKVKKAAAVYAVLTLILSCCGMSLAEEDWIFAQPGDSGADVELALAKCVEMGYLQSLPAGADTYLADYVPAVTEMEQALGLEADGILHLSEYEEIEHAVFEGAEGPRVREMLEWLYELGYIREKLPEPHDVYEKRYAAAIRNAEKKLGLTADGVLLGSEQRVICASQLAALPDMGSITLKRKDDSVTVSWKAVRGALRYAVYRNEKMVGMVEGKTSWTDESLPVDRTYTYKVQPLTYLREGAFSDAVSINVSIQSIAVTLADLYKSNQKYIRMDCYVDPGTMQFTWGIIANHDYHIGVVQTIRGRSYYATLVLENYQSWDGDIPDIHSKRFQIKKVRGIGKVTYGGVLPVIVMHDISLEY